jgi:tetratricopeptide (TPR) repeat protein
VEEYRGLPATYGNPNVATHTLNLGLLILLGLSTQRKTRWCFALAIPVALHLWFAEVRAARVAIPAGVCVAALGYFSYRFTGHARKSMGLACVATALLGLFAIAGSVTVSKLATGSFLSASHPILLRLNSYFGASQMILDRPLLGFGPGTYWIENPPYWTPYEQSFFATDSKYNANVHNEYLETGVESGFGGAFFYIAFLVSLVLLSLRVAFVQNDWNRCMLGYTLAACFTAFAVDGIFGFNLRSPASGLVLFVMAGILVGASTSASALPISARRRALPFAACVAGIVIAGFAGVTFASQMLHQKATAARTWGYPDVAARFLAQAESLVPWDASIVRDAAAVEVLRGHREEAISAYRRALALNPYWAPDYVALARLYLQLDEEEDSGYWRDTATLARRALIICPNLPEAHELLGRVAIAEALRGSGAGSPLEKVREVQVREGLGHLQVSLAYGSHDPGTVHRLIAQACFALGELDEAQNAFIRATESEVDNDITWTLFERYASETERWAPYTNALNGAIGRVDRSSPDDCEARSRLVWWLARAHATGLKDQARAATVLTSGIRACPENAGLWGAYVSLNRAEHDRARLEAVLSYLRQSIAKDQKPPEVIRKLIAYMDTPQANAVQEAQRFLDEWPRVVSENSTGDLVRAYDWLLSVYGSDLATAPQPPEVRGGLLLRLGSAAASIGAWAQADQIFTAALPLVPAGQVVECLLLRADALDKAGRTQEALRIAQDAAKRAPSDFRAQHAVARLLAVNGNEPEARLAYRLLLTRFGLDTETRDAVVLEMTELLGEGAP